MSLSVAGRIRARGAGVLLTGALSAAAPSLVPPALAMMTCLVGLSGVLAGTISPLIGLDGAER